MTSFPSLTQLIASKSDSNLKAAAARASVPPVEVGITVRKLLQGHFSKIAGVAWADDGSLYSAAQDGKLIHWNAVSGTKLGVASLQCEYVMAIDCCQGASQLISLGGMDNIISLYKHSSSTSSSTASSPSKPFVSLQGHKGYISSLSFFDGGRSSGDSCSMIWDVELQIASHVFKGSTGQGMTCGAPQPSSPCTFVTCEVDGHIQLWDSRAANVPVMIFHQPASSSASAASTDVNALSFLPGGAFVTAHDDEFCRQRESSSCVAATSLCTSRSGRLAFVGYADGTVKVWDVLTEDVCSTIKPVQSRETTGSGSSLMRHRISSLKLSPDGFAVASGSWDKSLRILA